MNAQMIYRQIEVLKTVFDIVRLVDVTKTVVLNVSEDGVLSEEPYLCFAVWNKSHRCENCISAQAYSCQGELTKFEFLNEQVCFVMAKYVTIEGTPYILEMVKMVDDKTLFGAYGKGSFIDKITSYNTKIYTDSLTGAYNRRYYDEQLAGLKNITAIAALDIDNFKSINDSFGHKGGDAALKVFAEVLMHNVRSTDAVIRLGGDEFVIAFQKMHQEYLSAKLEMLRQKVEAAQIPDYPDLHITTSIGGFYCDQYDGDFFSMSDEKLYEAKKQKNTVVV